MKPLDRMLRAYDDSLGVTAAFNLNLLVRINRELEGNFDPLTFEHLARFNEATSSMEMHIRSKRQQTVHVGREPDASYVVAFAEGETIWTESCHKYSHDMVAELAAAAASECTRNGLTKNGRSPKPC